MLQKNKGVERYQDFTKTLSNKNKVLDFEKVFAKKALVNIIISQRGFTGKTLNVKLELERFFKITGRPSLWIQNTNPLTESVKGDYKKDLNKPFVQKEIGTKSVNFWNNTRSFGDTDKGLGMIKHHDKPFIKLLTISQAEQLKGAREFYKYGIWDEFNVKFNAVRKPIEMLDSLLHTMEDGVSGVAVDFQLAIFGNNKTLNNSLINSLGVKSLDDEITEFRDSNGKLIILVIAPQFSEKDKLDFEDKQSENPIYQLSKQMGTSDHSYFNESFDEINNVIRYTDKEESAKNLILISGVYHSKRYFNVYSHKISGNLHIVEIRSKDRSNILRILQRNDVIENCKFDMSLKKTLRRQLSGDNITFEDVSSRELFISSLR